MKLMSSHPVENRRFVWFERLPVGFMLGKLNKKHGLTFISKIVGTSYIASCILVNMSEWTFLHSYIICMLISFAHEINWFVLHLKTLFYFSVSLQAFLSIRWDCWSRLHVPDTTTMFDIYIQTHYYAYRHVHTHRDAKTFTVLKNLVSFQHLKYIVESMGKKCFF